MSCGGSFGGCGGSSEMRIPLSSGGCGPTDYLYVSEHSSGCGGTTTRFTVDSGGCGGRVPASDRDIRRAFDNIRRNRGRNW